MPLFLKSIDPEIDVFGNRQSFNFNNEQIPVDNKAGIPFVNHFIPTVDTNAELSIEMLSKDFKGFRLLHELLSTSTYGNFSLQAYSRFGSSSNIFKYDESTDKLTFFKDVEFSGGGGSYITLTGAISGSGVGSIATTLTDINTGQITNFNNAVTLFPLNSFAVPTADINMNNKCIFNLSEPGSASDATTKNYVDNKTWNISQIMGQLPINRLENYPDNNLLFLNGASNWINPFAQDIFMSDNGFWLKNSGDKNHGLIYNSVIDGIEFRGNVGFSWNTGISGVDQKMTLTNDGVLSINSINCLNGTSISFSNKTITDVNNPIAGSDAANKNYIDDKIGSKLDYITTGDTNFPIRFTRALHVDNNYDSFVHEYGTYGYLNPGGATGVGSDAPMYDIKCNGRIRTSEVNVWSSKNIKNILARGQIIQNEAANLIQTLPTVKYNYKDPSLDGKGNYYGMISEEIKDYLPDYVTSEENKFAPNIMKQATATLLDYNTIGIIIENAERDYPDIIDKKIQIIAVKNACQGTVLSILGNTITVKTDFSLQLSKKTIDVFVYGTYEDCPTIAKMHLFDMALCALQNCLSRIQQLENKV